jgi:Asp-tRNA(Asn)/Glu-tRNA(Gln) amidotransferase A subunit family amidase
MTDETTTVPADDELTPEQAEEELARLEQAVVDGEEVTIEQLSKAKERISFAGLLQRGREKREAARREKEKIELRARTKAEVAAKFAARADNSPTAAYNRAVQALEALVTAVEDNNKLLYTATLDLRRGGVGELGWDNQEPEGFDRANYARVEQGDNVTAVVVNGATYRKEVPGLWAEAVLKRVAEAHRLTTPGGAHVASKLGSDLPVALQRR